MGIKIERDRSATGVGYYHTSVWDAHELVERLASRGVELEDEQPEYWRFDDGTTFKVTITVEEV